MEINRNSFVLVYFHEEKRYSTLKIKDAIKPANFELVKKDLKSWDRKKSLEIKWGHEMFPAYCLQFGENKIAMDMLIDSLADGSITYEEIPIIQDNIICTKRSRTNLQQEANSEEVEQQQSKRQKLAAIKEKRNKKEQSILDTLKNLAPAPKSRECSSCGTLKNELSVMKKQMTELAAEVQSRTERTDHYKKKYKQIKQKYHQLKENKAQMKENDPDLVRIGNHLHIDKCKLALCRVTDYSKYTCDLLDVVFGRQSLSNSVVKGIKGSTKKVLDPNIVADIQGHVSCKFNVNVALVRATIRNKLNSASKAVKSEKM